MIMSQSHSNLPLEGLRVLDFGHTVMGPCCGMILADLGAEVIKIEPVGAGDPTRTLKGFGSGYFGFFARNKKSFSVDLKSNAGKNITLKLAKTADIVIENFAPGTMTRLGLGYEEVSKLNPKIIYASLKGFMPGPYENRLALDEVVQMMGGLAFMTGPTGTPLRAGTSVVDISGGLFAVIGILSALRIREQTQRGQLVETALYETLVFLMGQHLCYASQSQEPIPPMPERISAWAIYDIFRCADDKRVFVGITTDNHWKRFCQTVEWHEEFTDPTLATNGQRIEQKARLRGLFQDLIAQKTLDEITVILDRARVPFAPVQRPEDLFDDPHLQATGGLLTTHLPDGTPTPLPRLPLELSGHGFNRVSNPPDIGQNTHSILTELQLPEDEINQLIREGAVQIDRSKSKSIKTTIQED